MFAERDLLETAAVKSKVFLAQENRFYFIFSSFDNLIFLEGIMPTSGTTETALFVHVLQVFFTGNLFVITNK